MLSPYAVGPESDESEGLSWWDWIKARVIWALLAIGLSTVVGWVFTYVSGSGSGTSSASSTTCEDAATWAVEISSEDNNGFVQLLDVRALETVIDRRTTYKPPTATEESLVLECSGTGVWSDGSRDAVRIRVTVDADDEVWVFYEPA